MRSSLAIVAGSLLLLSACGADNAKSEPHVNKAAVQQEEKAMEKKPLTMDYLKKRLRKGTNIPSYSVEIQSWVDKGKAEVIKTDKPSSENMKADMIKVSDGYLVVLYDTKEINDVQTFTSEKKAKDFIASK